MKLYQAHLALAAMAGDPIEILGSPVSSIPDGVRYSRRVRNVYLYRAMLGFLEEVVQQTAPLPTLEGDAIWSKMFPTKVIRDNVGALTGTKTEGILTRKPVRIMSVYTEGVQATPFRESTSRLTAGRYNPTNTQIFDPSYNLISTVAPDAAHIELHAPAQFVTAFPSSDVIVLYLPVPLDPEDQDPEDELDFEPTYLNGIINRANSMAQADNQIFQAGQ